MLLDYLSALLPKVGGDSALDQGWDKQAWARKKKKEDALDQTIVETYERIIGIAPTSQVVAEVAREAISVDPERPQIDYSGLAEWLQAQETIVAQIIARRQEEDDEEALLLLL